MHRFADDIVTAERKRNVADATADTREGKVLLDPFGRADEIDGVVIMFLDARGYGEDVGIENNVLCREADFLRQEAVGTLADLNLAFKVIGLAAFIKGHDDDGRAVTPDQNG